MSNIKYDLRGVKMTEHLNLAKQSVYDATIQGESTIITDQELVIKYLPVEAIKKRLKVNIKSQGDSLWKIVISKRGKN